MKDLGQRKPLKQWLGGKKKMFSELLRKPGAMRGERRVSMGQNRKGIKREFAFYPEGEKGPQKVLRRKAISVFAFLKDHADFSRNMETNSTKSVQSSQKERQRI